MERWLGWQGSGGVVAVMLPPISALLAQVERGGGRPRVGDGQYAYELRATELRAVELRAVELRALQAMDLQVGVGSGGARAAEPRAIREWAVAERAAEQVAGRAASEGDLEVPALVPASPPPAAGARRSHKKRSHIPRPRNAFILFRQHLHYQLFPKHALNSFQTNNEISREIGKRWRELPQAEKQVWQDLAAREKELHKLKYPEYRYAPRKTVRDTVRRRRSDTDTDTAAALVDLHGVHPSSSSSM